MLSKNKWKSYIAELKLCAMDYAKVTGIGPTGDIFRSIKDLFIDG